MYLHSSQYWTNHFTHNATFKRVDWSVAPRLSHTERKRILKSLQAWQLGETSEGTHLIAAAKKYANRTHDFIFPIAVDLFIREEQKHGDNLGHYLDLIGEKRIKKDWGDSLFRKIRYFNTSMELWTLAVITVESAAQLFYQSLKDATRCPLLKQICDDILIDEERHIEFQAERMLAIYRAHHWSVRWFAFQAYRVFFFSTAAVVWFAHRNVLRVGSGDFNGYISDMALKFSNTFGLIRKQTELAKHLVPMR